MAYRQQPVVAAEQKPAWPGRTCEGFNRNGYKAEKAGGIPVILYDIVNGLPVLLVMRQAKRPVGSGKMVIHGFHFFFR